MKSIYILDGLRTPIGGCGQSLRDVSAVDLGAVVLKGLLTRQGIKGSLVDEVIMGNVVSAGLGQNPARQSLVNAGLPMSTPGFTVNKVCGSGLKTVILAAQAITCGDSDIVMAGGMESASQCPYILPRSKRFNGVNPEEMRDSLIHDGLWCCLNDTHMGQIAEYTVDKFKISRQEQDVYAFNSHQKAHQAQEEGFFQSEITPVEGGGQTYLNSDEKLRKDLTMERLANLPSAFKKRGSVTAGNSSSPADGAAVLMLSSQQGLKKTKVKPIARILGYATVAMEPKLVFTGPALAIQKCLKASSLKRSDVDIFEINEAFAVQVLVTIKLAKIDRRHLNPFGGTLALGHPLGVSGARGLVTLMNALKIQKKKVGVTSVCLGGGSALSVAIRMLN